MKKTSVTCCITLIVAMLSLPVRAAETGNVWMKNDRASIGIGAFFVEEDTKVRLSSDTLGTGTRFSFQDDLGLDEDDEAVRLVGHYRFKPRHRINFGYFKISSDATTTVLRDIIFEDEVFTTGTTVNTKLSFAVLKILYTYSFFQNDTIDAQAVVFTDQGQYIHAFRVYVRRNLVIPPGTPESADAAVEVIVSPEGEVRKLVITQSSGYPSYDQAVERAVFQAQPLPVMEEWVAADRSERLILKFKATE